MSVTASNVVLFDRKMKQEKEYWLARLSGEPKQSGLVPDRPRPPDYAPEVETVEVDVPAETCRALAALTGGGAFLTYTTLMSALKVTLHKVTGRTTVAVGSPGLKPDDGSPGKAGALAIVDHVDGHLSFRELLLNVRQSLLDAYSRQSYPFPLLVRDLRLGHVGNRCPLFDVALILQDLHCDLLAVRNDVTITFAQSADRLSGRVAFDAALFRPDTIKRFAGHLLRMLQAGLDDTDTPVARLPLPAPAERHHLLVEWNDTRTACRERCIHELFEIQAEKSADAIAVACGEAHLTYRELDRRANRLAQHLRATGVARETPVGICTERSPEMAMGILAILKAGGAYVPLNPGYPEERLSFMLDDAGIQLVLAQESVAQSLPARKSNPARLDTAQAAARGTGEKPACAVAPDNLAYVTYTSGSTGRPKGCLATHRSVVNHSTAMAQVFDLGPADRVLQFASLNFDVLAEEIFPAWFTGATLVLLPGDPPTPDARLTQWIEREELTVPNLPASYWHEWVRELAAAERKVPACLRLVVVGSERVSPERLASWQELAGACRTRLINAYGTTETTVTSTFWELDASTRGRRPPAGEKRSPQEGANGQRGHAEVPIGRPIANTRLYLLDARLQPLPIGSVGELCIGGRGLVRGYLNHPGLTAASFCPDPFGDEPGARLYRTGDRGRALPDGNVEFLARLDRQVKLRGFRIELAEIEHTLKQHPAVQEAAVLIREDTPGDRRLAAYLVPQPQVELWPSAGEYPVHDELLEYAMVNDARRNATYRAAIERLVQGKTVVEIGAGKETAWAGICIEAGARKVFRIETPGDAHDGGTSAAGNPAPQDGVILLQGDPAEIQLPEKAGVCISDLIGSIGSSEGVVPILNDARRFLAGDGAMIPHRCVTKIAAVSLPEPLAAAPRFADVAGFYVQKIFDQAGYEFDLRLCVRNLPGESLVSSVAVFEELDFSAHVEPEYDRDVKLTITRDCGLNGFVLWLNLSTIEGEMIDSLDHACSWLPVYLPLFHPAVDVSKGDTVAATCRARLGEDGIHPDYVVSGTVIRKDGPAVGFERTSSYREQAFKSTPFYEMLFSGDSTGTHTAGQEITAGLGDYLGRRLPDYMIPSAFVVMDALPLTRDGKLDHDALPVPGRAHPGSKAPFVKPRTPAEEALARCWMSALDLERVGVHDNFFALGGHSLLAMRVISRIRQALEVEVPLSTIFEAPTIAGLAEYVETVHWARRGADGGQDAVPDDFEEGEL
jgi:amino acid adenylation domain-containing protein